MYTFKHTVI